MHHIGYGRKLKRVDDRLRANTSERGDLYSCALERCAEKWLAVVGTCRRRLSSRLSMPFSGVWLRSRDDRKLSRLCEGLGSGQPASPDHQLQFSALRVALRPFHSARVVSRNPANTSSRYFISVDYRASSPTKSRPSCRPRVESQIYSPEEPRAPRNGEHGSVIFTLKDRRMFAGAVEGVSLMALNLSATAMIAASDSRRVVPMCPLTPSRSTNHSSGETE
jgi:hypothetical protein